MSQYAGLYCPNADCLMFLVREQIYPSDPPSPPKDHGPINGTCPHCGHAYSVRSSEIVQFGSGEKRLVNAV